MMVQHRSRVPIGAGHGAKTDNPTNNDNTGRAS